jgi:hypothetical protein
MLVQCMNLKKIGKIFTSKFVGTGPSSYKKRIYWAAVSQRLRNTAVADKPVRRQSGSIQNDRQQHSVHRLRYDGLTPE